MTSLLSSLRSGRSRSFNCWIVFGFFFYVTTVAVKPLTTVLNKIEKDDPFITTVDEQFNNDDKDLEDHKDSHHSGGHHEHDEEHEHDHDHDHETEHDHDHEHDNDKKTEKPSSPPPLPQSKTLYAMETLLATLCISVFPILVIVFIPLPSTVNGKSTINKQWLKTLLAFAVGGLLGDVFLHLLPHAMSHVESNAHTHTHNHDHNHEDGHPHDHTAHSFIGIQILGGMMCFFLIEKLAVIYNGPGGHGHSHGNKGSTKGNQARPRKDDSKEEPKTEAEIINRERLRVAAILNIIADTVHNMTDGMAIAASFMVSQKVGFGTTVAVMIHEIPHEIGDLAILIRSGMSKKEVIMVQLLTAIGALVGALLGLFLGTQSSNTWIIPFTSGGFIYIATADVIPQLFEKTNLLQTIIETIAMSLGVFSMLLITFIE